MGFREKRITGTGNREDGRRKLEVGKNPVHLIVMKNAVFKSTDCATRTLREQ